MTDFYIPKGEPDGESLVIVLDGVSKKNFDDLYEDRSLPNIHRYFDGISTQSVVSTFPSVTGPAHCGYLGMGDPMGYEAARFVREKNRIENTYPRNIILRDLIGLPAPNSVAAHYDFSKTTLRHLITFLDTTRSIRGDVHRLNGAIERLNGKYSSIWFTGTDELTHRDGLSGLYQAAHEVDKIFPRIINKVRPREVLIFSDHGNDVVEDRIERANLEQTLSQHDFDVRKSLKDERDVVIPTFGFLTFASLYTERKNVFELASALVQNQAVDFVAYLDDEHNILVQNHDNLAKIESKIDLGLHIDEVKKFQFKYTPVVGDPLNYNAIAHLLEQQELVDYQGFSREANWIFKTSSHQYPNALGRLHGAFFCNKSPGDVLVSLKRTYHNGRKGFEKIMPIQGTHGSMEAAASVGFSLYMGPEQLPKSQMVYDLRPFAKSANPPKKGLIGLIERLMSTFKKK